MDSYGQPAFYGWHNALTTGRRITMWHKDRVQLIQSVFKRLLGGKDVFQYMLQNGWLDIGPQLKPITVAQQKVPIRECDLRYYEICLLPLFEHTGDADPFDGTKELRCTFVIGLVDQRLRVRQFTCETQELVSRSLEIPPRSFEVVNPCSPIIAQLKRFDDYIMEILAVLPDSHPFKRKRCKYADPFERILQSSSVNVISTDKHKHNDVPIFDANRKKVSLPQASGFLPYSRLKAIIQVNALHVIKSRHSIYHIFAPIQLKQLQIMIDTKKHQHGCMFGDEDDE